ncbi:MAG TPA: TRAP transporter small permease subunit [Microvirga sp.]|nr:TRAP transporter small permease subunit [Microvirga sp.]
MSEIVPSALRARENYAPADAFAPDRALAPVRLFFRWSSLALVAVMIMLPAIQVVLREVLETPFVGAEELARFMLICVVFVTFPYVVASGSNIRLEELADLFPNELQRGLRVLIAASGAIVFGIAGVSVAVATLRNLNNATPTLGIPYWVFFSAGFLGLMFASVECALQLWKALTRRPLYVTFADEAAPDDMAALEAAISAEADRSGWDAGR